MSDRGTLPFWIPGVTDKVQQKNLIAEGMMVDGRLVRAYEVNHNGSPFLGAPSDMNSTFAVDITGKGSSETHGFSSKDDLFRFLHSYDEQEYRAWNAGGQEGKQLRKGLGIPEGLVSRRDKESFGNPLPKAEVEQEPGFTVGTTPAGGGQPQLVADQSFRVETSLPYEASGASSQPSSQEYRAPAVVQPGPVPQAGVANNRTAVSTPQEQGNVPAPVAQSRNAPSVAFFESLDGPEEKTTESGNDYTPGPPKEYVRDETPDSDPEPDTRVSEDKDAAINDVKVSEPETD